MQNTVIKLTLASWLLALIMVSGCKKDKTTISGNGYPDKLADNWVAFELHGGSINGASYEPYDLVTSLDVNHEGYVILDKMYASDIRVRAQYTQDTIIHVERGEQLEKISKNTYNVTSISLDGYITTNPFWINASWQLANFYYPDLAFQYSDIKDVLYLHAGYYDKYNTLVDTVLLVAYRKTGFEEVSY